jgi:hypothetical protein
MRAVLMILILIAKRSYSTKAPTNSTKADIRGQSISTYLIGQIANNPKFLSSFNHDANRGYGYLYWDWQRQADPKLQPTDGQNRVLVPPVVWPEGADGKRWVRPGPEPVAPVGQPPDNYEPALKLWYPGRKCKDPEDDGDGGTPAPPPQGPIP